jgi:uncharacterized protein involved in exopolysaccharide biosynthesis
MQDDEIDLRDYINVIMKRKWIIIIVFAVFLMSASIMMSVMPKTYEAVAVIENGFLNEQIINTEDSIILLKIIGENKDVNIEAMGQACYLKITAYANTVVMAKTECEGVAQEYIRRGNELFNKEKDLYAQQLVSLNEQIAKVKEDTASVESMIDQMSLSESSPSVERSSQIILLQNTLSSYREQFSRLTEREAQIKNILVRAKEFGFVSSPVETKYPVKPKKKQMLVLSSILGLMAGFFIAFFVEYWKKEEK